MHYNILLYYIISYLVVYDMMLHLIFFLLLPAIFDATEDVHAVGGFRPGRRVVMPCSGCRAAGAQLLPAVALAVEERQVVQSA